MHSDPPRPPSRGASTPTVSPRKGVASGPARAARALGGSTFTGTAGPAAGPFAARYSDGRTALAHDAEVRIDASALVITLADGGQRISWPLAGLRTAQPLTPRSVDALVGLSGDEAQSLFVANPAFVRALSAAAPALTTRGQRWRHVRPWLIAGAVAAFAALAVTRFDLSPARAVARLLPDAARQKMGDSALHSMSRGHRVCTDARGLAAIDRLAARLSASLPADKRFKVVVVDWSLMNAFAVPGDRIVLTRGLLTRTTSPDEVAGVLAHEMGHGIELHPEAGMVRGLGMTAVADLLFGSGTVTNIGLLLAELSYSRGAEREADLHGLKLLREAGIAPRGLADFFRRVMKTESTGGKTSLPGRSLDVLSTHPATEERVRLVERQPTYPATPALSLEDWQALRGICGATPVTSPLPGPKPSTRPDAKPTPLPTDPRAGSKPGSPPAGGPKAPKWRPPPLKPPPPPEAKPSGERPIDL